MSSVSLLSDDDEREYCGGEGGVAGIPKDDTVETDDADGMSEGGLCDTAPVPYVLLDVFSSSDPYALARPALRDWRRVGEGMGIGAERPDGEVGPRYEVLPTALRPSPCLGISALMP